MNELELIENKEVRVAKLDRIEVLDRVGGLVLLPNTQLATTRQIAEYFNVGIQTIKALVVRNREDLTKSGMVQLKGVDLKNFKINNKIQNELKSFPSVLIFNKSSMLKMAFLLTESDVALKIRNIISKEDPELYSELSNKENQLRFKKYEMEIKNYLEFSFGKANVKSQIRTGKYNLDFLLFDNIHIEVDENGHKNYDHANEKMRQDYILKNTEYYTVRYNPMMEMPCDLIFKIKDIYDNIGYPIQLCN